MPPKTDDTVKIAEAVAASVREQLRQNQMATDTQPPVKEGWRFWRGTLNSVLATMVVGLCLAALKGRDDIKDMQSRIAMHDKEIAIIGGQTSVKELTEKVSQMSDRITSLTEKIAALTDRLNRYEFSKRP